MKRILLATLLLSICGALFAHTATVTETYIDTSTPTITPTFTITPTYDETLGPVLTQIWVETYGTATVTSTITPTYTITQADTSTVTPTFTVTPTITPGFELMTNERVKTLTGSITSSNGITYITWDGNNGWSPNSYFVFPQLTGIADGIKLDVYSYAPMGVSIIARDYFNQPVDCSIISPVYFDLLLFRYVIPGATQ